MRILLTNCSLESRGGSELYVSEMANWLRSQGHVPIIYSARPGPLAAEIRRRAIPVVDDLTHLAEAPDIIHGQHHLATMTALGRFPDTPTVYFCHGWLPWEESPPRHPAIRRYVAVSGATRERLVSENGVAPDRVRVLPNFVDLDRFRERGPLPRVPGRALVFSNQTNVGDWVEIVRAACVARGIALDIAGYGCGRPLDPPEAHLCRSDLIFARGRCALEAMATGVASLSATRKDSVHLSRRKRSNACETVIMGCRCCAIRIARIWCCGRSIGTTRRWRLASPLSCAALTAWSASPER